MNSPQHKIYSLTKKLQTQSDLPLWKLADERVIYSAATSEKIKWGPKLSLLHRIMHFAYKINITDVIIFFVGIARATSIWWTVKKKTFKATKQKKKIFKRIFSGFGASSEECLYADYIAKSNNTTLRINCVTHDGIHELGCPRLLPVLYFILQNAFGYTNKVRRATHEIASNAVDFMTVYAVNVSTYAFYRSFWKKAKLQGVKEVVVLALDIPAHACVDEEINTIYLQHGLMALSILIPKLNCINVLTHDEELFLQSTTIIDKIDRPAKRVNNLRKKNDILMIMSLDVFQEERLLVCDPLIRWAKGAGLQIVVRPTPKVTHENLTTILQRIPLAFCDDLTLPLHQSFEKWRPRFVAAWTSTGLATALDHDCLPVSLCDPEASDIWNNIVYPMRNRVLFWPRDASVIEAAIQSENAYDDQLKKLRSYQPNFYVAFMTNEKGKKYV